tara:strand:- start:4820 stop:5191 length:372 start_codon:yes stop_codon:yes gene_type:complete
MDLFFNVPRPEKLTNQKLRKRKAMKTKEKHATFTPGPWVVKHDKQGLPFIGVASDPWTYQGTVATVDTGEADARLIAAAPEMLKALKDIYEINVPDAEWSPTLERCFGLALEILAKVGYDRRL